MNTIVSLPDKNPDIQSEIRVAASTSDPAPTVPLLAPPPGMMAVGVGILTVIASIAALYFGRAFFIPLLIGILTSYALHPIVDWLKAYHIPRAVGAALVLIVLIAAAAWLAISLKDDAEAMIEKLPEAARKVRQHVSDARESGPTAFEKIQEAATELQKAAADATGANPSVKPSLPAVAIQPSEPGSWWRDYLFAQSAPLIVVISQTPIVLLLAYFLLASGEHFRRKLVQLVGPSLSHKKDAVRILQEVDVQIQRYLFAIMGSNILVAIGTWLAFEALGMEQAGVWGVIAGVLHFIPYLGPVMFATLSGIAAFIQFGTILEALIIAGASLLVATIVGSVFMTWLQSRLARVNAAVLFISLLFFGWLWGIWGLLLGAPLIAIIKVICDRVESLKPVSELLGP